MASSSWSLTSWCEQHGLGEKTQSRLVEEDIITPDLLVSLTEEDINGLKLSIGQRRALVKAVEELKKRYNIIISM